MSIRRERRQREDSEARIALAAAHWQTVDALTDGDTEWANDEDARIDYRAMMRRTAELLGVPALIEERDVVRGEAEAATRALRDLIEAADEACNFTSGEAVTTFNEAMTRARALVGSETRNEADV